ncbi:MAG: 4-hydroxy-tetrahydrodipicolinate synthase [Campylobacterales bacterium]|nr:4-hydroxy-tetrahydrodipicolinate synthase [Campylobacterales bacterium]
MTPITGAMTALITPLKNGTVDEETYEKLIKRQIENGIDAVVPVGTTGESATLTYEEHKKCIEIAVATCKGTNTKVIAGAGSNATHESIELAKFAQSAGADEILCVAPYYNKPSQEGLYQHYKAIANSVDIGVMLYNVPGRTSVDLTAETAIRLFDDVKNINSIKEATGSLERVVEINSQRPDFAIISGDDAINYSIMANGGKGCISVTSNLLPDMVAKTIHLAAEGKLEEAKEMSNKLYPINNVMFIDSNPVPVKTAMYIAGLIPTLEFKLPLVGISEENLKILKEVVKKYV